MPKIHIKGRILQLLERSNVLWDHEISEVIQEEYGLQGAYWVGTIRMTLTDLHAGGLIDHLESRVDPRSSKGAEKLLNRYRLNGFGRERMHQTGLMENMS